MNSAAQTLEKLGGIVYWHKFPVEIVGKVDKLIEGYECYVIKINQGYVVATKDSLYKRKNTALGRMEEEIKNLECQRDELVKKMQDDAIKALSARIKMNAVFGATGNATFAVAIAAELEKLIKADKPPKL